MGLNVYYRSECCFSRALIDSPEGNKPNGNYFMENACVRFLFTKSEVREENELAQRTSGVFDTYQGVNESHSKSFKRCDVYLFSGHLNCL